MLSRLQLFVLVCFCLPACAVSNSKTTDNGASKITIDDEVWTLTLEAPKCDHRVATAIDEYWKAPLYRKERKVMRERYLTNDSSDCWIELYIQGVDDFSVLFKISDDNKVLDKRGLSTWLPRISPYPEEPIYLG